MNWEAHVSDKLEAYAGLETTSAEKDLLHEFGLELEPPHGSYFLPDGKEAEELRQGIERVLDECDDADEIGDRLRSLMDEIDARDSVTYLDATLRLDVLAARVMGACVNRQWSTHWTARGAYLHLEASELIEAVRGKRGDPLGEAADVLFVLMSITESNGIRFSNVVRRTAQLCTDLSTAPRYAGEDYLSIAAHPERDDRRMAGTEPRALKVGGYPIPDHLADEVRAVASGLTAPRRSVPVPRSGLEGDET